MPIREIVKKIWLSLTNKNRVVLLDYAIKPERLYTEERKNPHGKLFDLINSERLAYQSILHSALKYHANILSIKEDNNVLQNLDPGWNNGHFPGLDIIMLYALLAEIKPKQYVEIGSGTSTRVVYKARKDNNLSLTITSIDPSARKEIKEIADKIEAKELQKVSLDYFRSLNAGDVLFFDGTHTLYPNSDVMWFFLEVLPILKAGVYVHVHDIYLPYDYPQFMCNRYYNEQYVLGTCLVNNPSKYKIICPNYFIYTEKELHGILQPLWNENKLVGVEKHGGSFWFKIA